VNCVRSSDGTTIAFDRLGQGDPLIVVGGAFSSRTWKGYVQLAELLGDRYTVVTYDRRGRGDSGETPPYAVEREIEDLAALIEAVGGAAFVWGMSSGGVLALRASAAGVAIRKLAVYQPPFLVNGNGHRPPADFETKLGELVAADRRGKAVAYFMREGMEAPAPFVALLRIARPLWSRLTAVAHTLPYDYAVMGKTLRGNPLDAEPWASVATPTLVLDGRKSPGSLHTAADALAAAVPDATRVTLEGQSHNVSMKLLAPVLAEFFAGASAVERSPERGGEDDQGVLLLQNLTMDDG
jgi:pimeloyl-ACP methyl ester carboxylesterase